MRGWWRCPLCGAMVRPSERPTHLMDKHKGELEKMKPEPVKKEGRRADLDPA